MELGSNFLNEKYSNIIGISLKMVTLAKKLRNRKVSVKRCIFSSLKISPCTRIFFFHIMCSVITLFASLFVHTYLCCFFFVSVLNCLHISLLLFSLLVFIHITFCIFLCYYLILITFLHISVLLFVSFLLLLFIFSAIIFLFVSFLLLFCIFL